MRILLLGEYSNVHATLAEGFRVLGHECVVASDGDSWKDYPRDIDLRRGEGKREKMRFLMKCVKSVPSFKGFDVVQLINPMFLELKAQRLVPLYHHLRKHNGKMVMGSFGMDYFWAHVNTHLRPLRYSDFNFGETIRMDQEAEMYRKEWMDSPKEALNRMIADDCDGIVAGLYEYWATYQAPRMPEGKRGVENESKGLFEDKLTFIPFPIKMPEGVPTVFEQPKRVKIFVGISKGRSVYKGTDIMLRAALKVQEKYPERLEIEVASGVPFAKYQDMMNSSDAILDQLYSYTPAMNSLLAMSKGIINIGGGEPENYEILGEKELRPIINVQPTLESCYEEIEKLVLHPEGIPKLKRESVEYVKKHHDYVKVAQQYLDFYEKL